MNLDLRIETTNQCNANCVMCTRKDMTRKVGTMDEKLVHSILNQAANIGIKKICFNRFGEPLLDPKLFDHIRYARSVSPGVVTYFITNGSLLKDRADEVMDSGVSMVKVSMSSLRKEVYEKITRGVKFEDAVGGLKSLLGKKMVRRRLNEPSIPKVGIIYLILPENKDEDVQEFQRFWDWKGVSMFSFWRPHDWNNSKSYRCDGPRVKCHKSNLTSIEVDHTGKVLPCCFDYDSKMVLGDLTKDSLKDIIEGKTFKEFTELHEKARDDDSVLNGHFCENCHERSVDVRPLYAVGWNE